ncbi:MAG: hypothetical protein Q9195_003286 [Heterodermia aff. obscurata]
MFLKNGYSAAHSPQHVGRDTIPAMVPPPITPASHRFLPSTSIDKPTRPPPLLHTPQPTSSSHGQFAATPRFSFGSSDKKPTDSSRRPPFSLSPFASGLVTRHDEEIEEPSLEHEQEDVQIQHRPGTPHEIEDPPQEAPSTPPLKRRRLLQPPAPNTERIIISSSPSSAGSPPVTPNPIRSSSTVAPSTPPPFHRHPPTTTSSTHPRFHFTLPTHPSPSPPSIKPTFLLPPASPPPPAALSTPHRRGQRYSPGGLASTVREWVFETARGRNEDWDVILQAEDINVAEGVILVAGRGRDEGEKWILIGKPKNRAGEDVGGSGLGRGVEIGIRKPNWELIFPGGEKWQVGVEWTVTPDRRMEPQSPANV